MRIPIAALAAAAALLLLAGCGSSGGGSASTSTTSSNTTSSSATATSTSTASAVTSTTEAKPVPPSADTIHPGSFFAFKMPSSKIGCAYTSGPTTLRCDTAYPTRFSHSGHTCQDGDYGQSFEMSPAGRSRAICAGDTVLSANDSKTIPYGHSWTVGPYNCASKTSGITCTNRGGHGWRLSVQAQILF